MSAQPQVAGKAQVAGKVRKPLRTGCVDSKAAGSTLIRLVQALAWVLIALSVVGTFYTLQGMGAPLFSPFRIIGDVVANLSVFGAALIIQVVLSLFQWGGASQAADDNRWWYAYGFGLGMSVWLNIQAFEGALIGLGIVNVAAWALIIAADVIPEIILKR